MKKDNRGFTLAELLVAMAVVAIVGSLIGGFLVFSTRTYGKVTKEAGLQENAQIVLSQLDNYMIDADASLRYFVDPSESGSGTEVLADSLYTGGAVNFQMKRLEIYKHTDTGISIETLTWKASAGTLTYKKEQKDSTGSVVTEVLEQVLATEITEFAVDLTEAKKQQVEVSVTVEHKGKSYQAESVIYLRNKILEGTEVDTETFVPVVPTVLNVKVIPQTIELKPGSRKTFQAVVYGTNNPSQEVDWSFGEHKPKSLLTTLDPSTGRLWISTDETADQISVTATSTQDPTKSATAEVTVIYGKKLSLGTIRDYWTYPGYSIYLYGRVNGELEGSIQWEIMPGDTSKYEATYFDALHAVKFKGRTPGDYIVKISGVVDGRLYEDQVTIHVREESELSSHVHNSQVRFVGNNGMEYWVQAGETVNLDTELVNYALGNNDETRERFKRRYWSWSATEGLTCELTAYGAYDKSATVVIPENAPDGEVWVNARIKDDWGNYYYDTIVIHVYEPFDFPYIVEAVNIAEGKNFYSNRATYRGPVKKVEHSGELTDLSAGILGMLGNDYTEIKSSGDRWNGGLNQLNGKTYIHTTDGKGVSLKSETQVAAGGVIVTENDLTLSCENVSSLGDTVIYVKGDHTLRVGWQNCYFDGIIYAPEGSVELECESGFFRGIIIAKNLKVAVERGDGNFSVLEKQSVMDMVNKWKAD